MGRDIQAIKISGEDRRKYREKVQRSLDVFARMLRERRFEASPSRVGVEIELNLVDSHGMPSMRNAAVLDAIADPAWATELGQFNLEINVPPRRLEKSALADLEQEIRASLNAADAKARGTGSGLVMVGILPTLAEEDMHEETLSANDRYRVLNEQIFAARGEDMRIDIDGAEHLLTHAGSITPEAACTSVQLHVQVSPDAFASYWNAAQAIAGCRSRWPPTPRSCSAGGCGTRPGSPCSSRPPTPGPDELKQQGVRPRVWFGERWITSVFDLFEENLRYFPSLLPLCEDEDPLAMLDGGDIPHLDEMSLHNGTIYRWNRPVYAVVDGQPHLRVENRVLPAGPTVADVMANAAFYYGLVRALADEQRPVWTQMTFATAAENLHEARAARHGCPALLARAGRGARGRTGPAPPAAAGPRGPPPLGCRPGLRGPPAGHHRAALPTGRNGATWQIATTRAISEQTGPGARRRSAR